MCENISKLILVHFVGLFCSLGLTNLGDVIFNQHTLEVEGISKKLHLFDVRGAEYIRIY